MDRVFRAVVGWGSSVSHGANESSRVLQGLRRRPGRRHRIGHFPFLKLDSVRKAADLGVPVCIQPNIIEVKAEDFLEKMGPVSRKLVDTMVPLRTLNKEGFSVAYGADVPAFPSYSPLDSIRSAMDRKTETGRQLNPGEAVSFLDALRLHTIGSAYAAFDETELGSLEPGKFADFVIWGRGLTRVSSGRAAVDLRVLATCLAGKPVYQAAGA
jgi:predicted amidohydrolase YtcJ